ncbi:hypothetical protein [Streptomyces sp. NPDC018045]|uniref:hypothetical protein n=1 Tax=Streptomyces sp. NPDC018045 TaxID=3365037 RepID=UPI003794916A
MVRCGKNGTLRKASLLLTEQPAVDLVAYLFQQLGDRARMERWLRGFGDEVCQAQQHNRPAGPTAIEILSVVAEDLTAPPRSCRGGAPRPDWCAVPALPPRRPRRWERGAPTAVRGRSRLAVHRFSSVVTAC